MALAIAKGAGMRLKGKSAIVTGAGSGFGARIAERFAAEGARVLLADINADAAARVAAPLANAASVGADVSSAEGWAAIADAQGGPPDIMVNNAGITHARSALEDVPEPDFDRVFAVNCKSVYHSARTFTPAMKARGSGVFLNIASTAGISPRAFLNWYNASKGWMITATKTMAVELAPAGIRVNAINPVAGETPLLASFMGEDTPQMRQAFLNTIPLGRFSTPDDIAQAAVFLCSDEASLITGVALEVDGGRCI